jgi:hypothetical protein
MVFDLLLHARHARVKSECPYFRKEHHRKDDGQPVTYSLTTTEPKHTKEEGGEIDKIKRKMMLKIEVKGEQRRKGETGTGKN